MHEARMAAHGQSYNLVCVCVCVLLVGGIAQRSVGVCATNGALVAEEIANPELDANLRQDMVKAHNMACLRRDVDSQATLLNLMLHDLLKNSQSKSAKR